MTTPYGDVAAAAQLGRDTARVDSYDLSTRSSLVVARMREDEQIVAEPLERYLPAPNRPRGEAVLYEPHDFCDYVTRLADTSAATVWADQDRNSVTAVLNDHADPDAAGWRDHRVVLRLQTDPDWQHWASQSGVLMPQEAFAEHLEEGLSSITDPPAADMLEVATTFHARRNLTFGRAVTLESGELQLTYQEESSASAGRKNSLEVPRQFTLRLSPYRGLDPVAVSARLRWRIEAGGALRLGYFLARADEARREAFERVVDSVTEAVPGEVPVLAGQAPDSVYAWV